MEWGADAIEPVTDSTVIMTGQTGEVSWDVTVDVQTALANEDTEIQWLLKRGRAVFYSKEGAAEVADMTKAPRLVLEFVE